ncbi:MAG: hypothetical protein JOZ72_00505, partial [Alphaproteobacteria bacterium]|nr:hypothetical protein [Alphaproteobacteria bacterium]
MTLPAMQIGTAPLIGVNSADTFFSTKRVVNATKLAQLEGKPVGTDLPTPPEIVELARALKNNPDLIYEYVRNNIDVVWMYGLHKGALGTLIDKSGTPFDQAALMVALLNQAGYQATYQIGWIQLSSAQFAAWTGVSDKNAACQMLANGGISAVFDGTAQNVFCGTGAGGSFGNVKLNHIWVKVTIPGSSCASACLFDPSYKSYTKWTGIDVKAAAEIGSGASSPLSIATTGMTTGTLTGGVPSNLGFNTNGSGATAGLFDKLSTYSQNVLDYLYANHLETAHMEDVAGGGVITPYVSPAGGLRQTSLPYMGQQTANLVAATCAVPATSVCVVPDVYRTTLRVRGYMYDYDCISQCPSPNAAWKNMFDAPFFADEIYGRSVTMDTDYGSGNYYKPYQGGPNRFTNLVTLHVDGVQVLTPYFEPAAYMGSNGQGFPIVASTRGAPAYVTLDVDHPYAATGIAGNTTNNGGYMREEVTKPVRLITGLTVVTGFGDASPSLFNKLSEERGSDSPMPYETSSCPEEGDGGKCVSYYPGGTGDFERLKLATSWMAQYSRAARLHAAIGGMTYQLHHVLGVAYGDALLTVAYQQNPPYGSNPDTPQADNFNRLDIDSGVSMQSRTADAAKRRAVIAAFAASASALEGSVASQLDDLPDNASTAARFEWANTPQGFGYWDSGNAYEDPAGVRRAFVQFDSGNIGTDGANAGAVALVENHTPDWYGVAGHCGTLDCGNSSPGGQPTISQFEAGGWQGAYKSDILAYVGNGYSVVTSQEAFLGPGQRASGDIQWATGKDGNGHTTYGYYAHAVTKQRGPAFVANLYDVATGLEPVAIAHAVVALGSYFESSVTTKGGGGGAQPNQSTSYSPAEAGDILKSHFVDKSNLLGVNLSNGSFGYSAPAKIVTGNGGFPYELSAEFQWNPQAPPPPGQAPVTPVAPNPGWTTSWQNRLAFAGSGLEAMGQSDVRAAVGTLAAFAAEQDVYAQTPSMAREVTGVLTQSWWVRQMWSNTITVALGTQSRQFLGLPQGVSLPTGEAWFLPGPTYATLSVTGARTAYEQKCTETLLPRTPYAASRGWDYSGVSAVDVTNAGGDVQHFVPWSNKYITVGGKHCGYAQGFRLASWTFPKGGSDAEKLQVTLTYGNAYDPEDTAGHGFERLLSVQNSIGRQIDFTLDGYAITGF